MSPGFLIPFALLVFVTVGVALLLHRQGYTTNWHKRYKLAKFALGYFAISWVVMCILNLTNDRPFWPHEAIGLLGWAVGLGGMFFSWRHAKRKAAEIPLSPPEQAKPHKPTFIWQAVLILLPVAIMTAVGFVALMRDRAAVENEARQHAEELIQQLQANFGRRVASELSTIGMFSYQWIQHQSIALGGWPGSRERLEWEAVSTNYPSRLADWQRRFPNAEPETVLPNSIMFDAAGKMDIALVGKSPPEPPDWFKNLTREQRVAWLALNTTATEGDRSSASNRASIFLTTNPSEDAKANARFILLRNETRNLDAEKAIAKLLGFAWPDRRVLSESGVPLSSLAFAEMVNRAKDSGPNAELWRELSDQVQSFPSYLTPLLLDQVQALVTTNRVLRDGVAAWQTLWRGGERARGIAEAIHQSGQLRGITTTNLWVDYDGTSWFCILQPEH